MDVLKHIDNVYKRGYRFKILSGMKGCQKLVPRVAVY